MPFVIVIRLNALRKLYKKAWLDWWCRHCGAQWPECVQFITLGRDHRKGLGYFANVLVKGQFELANKQWPLCANKGLRDFVSIASRTD